MKNTAFFILFILFRLPLLAQDVLYVSESKVTHLVCPDKVSYLQAGDANLLLAEVVSTQPNLIRVKAIDNFEMESSLTVVCDGKIYSLLVRYRDTCEICYELESFLPENAEAQIPGLSDYGFKKTSIQLLAKPQGNISLRSSKENKVKLSLKNIYQQGGALYFELQITNTSNLPFKVESYYWWIKDGKRMKATNTQEYRLAPLYQHYGLKIIPAGESIREVFVLQGLFLPDKRILQLELLEDALGNTGRKLSLGIKNRHLLKAKGL